ncbi:hypothetical protein [Phenylobacterium sp.]|uniref:hypothetical protein n=1 Tax=Phenylobacterium sp. TaxID=1871053 RepID=UPI00286BED17|nr:hypothetical protein [Phenylobacterium sp.]
MTPRKPGASPQAADAAPPRVTSPAFLELAARVLDGRAAYRAQGLSARGTRVLQALGYLSPVELFGARWDDRPGDPGLRGRALELRGCGPATLRDLQAWLSRPWGA